MKQLRITIKRQSAAKTWPVELVEEQLGPNDLPITTAKYMELDLVALLSRNHNPHAYGAFLGQQLFAAEELRIAFERTQRASHDCLRLLLDVQADDLLEVHWERLCVPVGNDWVVAAIDQRLLFSRYLPSPIDRNFPPFVPKALRVLILVASPTDCAQYRLRPFAVEPVVKRLQQSIGPANCTVLAQPPTLDTLCAALQARFYPVVYLACHGALDEDEDHEPILYLANAEGETDSVTASRLIERLQHLGGQGHLPHLLFLMSCYGAAEPDNAPFSGLAQQLVNKLGLPAVVAMNDQVTLSTAERLAASFYPHLRRHGEVDRALAEARLEVVERHDATLAMLYGRLGGRPLFVSRPHRWPLYLATLTTVVLALMFVLNAVNLDDLATWVAIHWPLDEPTPTLPTKIQVALPTQPTACLDQQLSDLVTELGLTPMQSSDLTSALANGAWAGIAVECGPHGVPITATVVLTSVSPLPIDLLQEPERLTYVNGSSSQVRNFMRGALFYSLGKYSAADKLFPTPADTESDVAWLRGNIALRLQRWSEANNFYDTAQKTAEPAVRVRLVGNQLLNKVHAHRSRSARMGSPTRDEPRLLCFSKEVSALDTALAATTALTDLQWAELKLIGVTVRLYCPDEVESETRRAKEETAALSPFAAHNPLIARQQIVMLAQISAYDRLDNPSANPLVIRDAACLALKSDSTALEVQRILGRIYAVYNDDRLDNFARKRFAAYGRQAPLAWQRRDALYQSLLLWNRVQRSQNAPPVPNGLDDCP